MSEPTIQDKLSDVLIFGQGRTASSISACLSMGGSSVTLITEYPDQDKKRIQQHLEDGVESSGKEPTGSITVKNIQEDGSSPSLVVITGYSDLSKIQSFIQSLEELANENLIISIATDHIPLSELQKKANQPENIVVMNWAEPAHTTFFLEIVHNEVTDPEIVSLLEEIAKEHWGKDPYKVHADLGVRSRMQTAMLREAMYLIDEGYANVEDIDRACRNDAGTYMPFAGNFQYIDLMGTYAYGVVMEKLNEELSSATKVSPFVNQVLSSGKNGMTSGQGFYNYSEEEATTWEARMRRFSFEIRELMEKYPNS